MLFSELYKILVNKVTFVGFKGSIAPLGQTVARVKFTEQVEYPGVLTP